MIAAVVSGHPSRRALPLIFALLFFSCDGSGAPPPDELGPGAFSLTELRVEQDSYEDGARSPETDLPAPPPEDGDGAPVDFDLGDLRGSDDFLFILANTGQAPITDVRIESDDEAFEVTPGSIDVLEPSADSAVNIVLRVRVLHGSNPTGEGHLPVLPMGTNEAAISITGQTVDESEQPIDLSLTVGVRVNALLVDFALVQGGEELDLGQPDVWVQGICYAYPSPSALRNDGNAPLQLRFYQDISPQPIATETVEPGAASSQLEEGDMVAIDPLGVTMPPDKYPLAQGAMDGAIVLCF